MSHCALAASLEPVAFKFMSQTVEDSVLITSHKCFGRLSHKRGPAAAKHCANVGPPSYACIPMNFTLFASHTQTSFPEMATSHDLDQALCNWD